MRPSLRQLSLVLGVTALLFGVAAAMHTSPASAAHAPRNQVIVPEEDRFTPFAQTIHVGQSVRWTNMDTDDHTVVTDNPLTTAGNRGVDIVIPGTDSNGGSPGTTVLTFSKPGTFVYYCRFHSHLDAASQPVAPGPDGGIEDDDGNLGTPMMGVITVLP